ncbi:MAG TPA: hypothetical protein VEA16_07870 [Vicinamibacterales bacterium]|nr:hypothetical protein [Vicinamibacterales bacterium]
MAYCVVSDIVALAPGVEITNTSKPTAGQVVTMIADLERELNAQLTRLGYSTPIVQATSPLAFQVVKHKLAHAALAQVLRARAYGSSSPREQGADDAQKVFDSWLKALKEPNDPTELPSDATRTSEVASKTHADQQRSHVQGLASDEFDIASPPVTMRQTF